jgi:hypothetical protein
MRLPVIIARKAIKLNRKRENFMGGLLFLVRRGDVLTELTLKASSVVEGLPGAYIDIL